MGRVFTSTGRGRGDVDGREHLTTARACLERRGRSAPGSCLRWSPDHLTAKHAGPGWCNCAAEPWARFSGRSTLDAAAIQSGSHPGQLSARGRSALTTRAGARYPAARRPPASWPAARRESCSGSGSTSDAASGLVHRGGVSLDGPGLRAAGVLRVSGSASLGRASGLEGLRCQPVSSARRGQEWAD
jgi:hypothetical protein